MRAKTWLWASAAALFTGITTLMAATPASAAPVAGPAAHQVTVAVAASGAISLPLKSFGSIVADTRHGHLFLSQGATGGDILVTTLAGKVVTSISGAAGAGMTLSPDGATLYVADTATGSVVAIDTATLTVAARYGIGSDPISVAVQDDKVWVGYGASGNGDIGDIDLSATTPAFTPQPTMSSGWLGAPQLAADPSGGGTLVAAEPVSSPGFVATFDVSTATPTVLVPTTALGNCENQQDLAVAPGGKEFVLACGAPYNHYRYSTADLSQLGDYPSDSYPNAVAIAPDGTVAAGIQGWYSPDVYVYHQDKTAALNKYEFGGPEWNLVPQGLAWAADSSTLYAVIQDLNTSAYALRVLPDPERTVSAISLSGTTSAPLGSAVTLRGKLTISLGSLPAGTSVTITRTGPGGTKRFTAAVSSGAFTLTDHPSALGSYVYSASYAGDASRQPATASRTVTITRLPVTLTLATSARTVNYGGHVTVTAYLGKTYSSRTVSIYAQGFGLAVKHLLRTGRVSSSGTLSASYAATRSVAFSVTFGGDAKYAPKTVKRNVYTRARVVMANSGWYTSTYINGTLYRVYHHTANLNATVTVAPNKHGECVVLESQQYDTSTGTWFNDQTYGCGTLGAKSTVSGSLGLKNAAGGQFRLRANYTRSSTDHTNLNNDSAWFYFIVVQ